MGSHHPFGHLKHKLWPKEGLGVKLPILKLPFGSPETKCHLYVGFVEKHKVYYKGEGGGFPPSLGRGESCESELPMACPSTKSASTMH